MESIIKALKDPSWWFTALFCGVVIAIIVAPVQKWATDAFYSIAAKNSAKWAERKRKKKIQRQKDLFTRCVNPSLLIIDAVVATFQMISSFVMFVSATRPEPPGLPKWAAVPLACSQGLVLIAAFLSLYSGFSSYLELLDAVRVYRAYLTQEMEKIEKFRKLDGGSLDKVISDAPVPSKQPMD